MMIILVVAVILLLIAVILTFYVSMILEMNNKPSVAAILILCFTAAGTLGLFDSIVYSSGIPQAIDVYRGKTTLEITYRDSIPVDSVVVYKK